MLVQLDTLSRMFADQAQNACLSYNGQCRDCGRRIKLEIHHLASGFGLLGGVLYETDSQHLAARCEACYKSALEHLNR